MGVSKKNERLEKRSNKSRKITVKIAEKGALLLNTSETSGAGHMWISTDEGSFGFAPKIKSPVYKGHVVYDDDSNYMTTLYERDFYLTENKYKRLIRFVKKPYKYGFSMYYDLLTNSCVDFVWKALHVGGIETEKYQGDLIPSNNVDDIAKLPGKTQSDIKNVIAQIEAPYTFINEKEYYKLNDYELETAITKQLSIMKSLIHERTKYDGKDKEKLNDIEEKLKLNKSLYNLLNKIKTQRIIDLTKGEKISNESHSRYKALKKKELLHKNFFMKKRNELVGKAKSSKYTDYNELDLLLDTIQIDMALEGKYVSEPDTVSDHTLSEQMRIYNDEKNEINRIEKVFSLKKAIGYFDSNGFSLLEGETYKNKIIEEANKKRNENKDILENENIRKNKTKNLENNTIKRKSIETKKYNHQNELNSEIQKKDDYLKSILKIDTKDISNKNISVSNEIKLLEDLFFEIRSKEVKKERKDNRLVF